MFEVDAEEPRVFDEGDVGFLSTYANMIGMALARFESEQKALRTAQQRTQADAIWATLVRELQHRVKNKFADHHLLLVATAASGGHTRKP